MKTGKIYGKKYGWLREEKIIDVLLPVHENLLSDELIHDVEIVKYGEA